MENQQQSKGRHDYHPSSSDGPGNVITPIQLVAEGGAYLVEDKKKVLLY